MKREAGRLAGENNSLHLQLMQLTEEREALELQHKRRVKDLQGQISELGVHKTASNSQLHAMEREITELKRRLETSICKEDTPLPPGALKSVHAVPHVCAFDLKADSDVK